MVHLFDLAGLAGKAGSALVLLRYTYLASFGETGAVHLNPETNNSPPDTWRCPSGSSG